MYTIKQAAARTGLSVPVLRAWERRYGVVRPERTQGGYRLYGDDDVTRFRAMRTLVERGWEPRAAAAFIRGASSLEIQELAPVPENPESASSGYVERFVAAAATLSSVHVESLLDEMFALGSFESAWERAIDPALRALGDAWADGQIDVAAEHAASHAVLRRLAAAFEAAGRAIEDGGVVIVGLPPGVRHELGALAFATAARRAQIRVLYLGADVPVDDWVNAVAHAHASAVVIGVVMDQDAEPAVRVARAVRATYPDVLLALGGRSAAPARERFGDEDARVIALPDALRAAVETLVARLRKPVRG